MKTRLWIAALIYPMVNALLFGIGTIFVLSVPSLAREAGSLFIWHTAASFVLAAPIAWMIAPRLRLRYWRQREAA